MEPTTLLLHETNFESYISKWWGTWFWTFDSGFLGKAEGSGVAS